MFLEVSYPFLGRHREMWMNGRSNGSALYVAPKHKISVLPEVESEMQRRKMMRCWCVRNWKALLMDACFICKSEASAQQKKKWSILDNEADDVVPRGNAGPQFCRKRTGFWKDAFKMESFWKITFFLAFLRFHYR